MGAVRYDWPKSSMNASRLYRLVIAAGVVASALLVSGCNSNSSIAPNWYDSAFYKDGALVNGNPPNTAPTADPANQ